MPWAKKRDGT
jgi:type II secretory pathway component PulJ